MNPSSIIKLDNLNRVIKGLLQDAGVFELNFAR